MRGKLSIGIVLLVALAMVFTGVFGFGAVPAKAAGGVVVNANVYTESPMDGVTYTVVDISVTNNTAYRLSQFVLNAQLPEGAKLVDWRPGTTYAAALNYQYVPQYRRILPIGYTIVAWNQHVTDWQSIQWIQARGLNAGDTIVGYQYKFTGGKGSFDIGVSYSGEAALGTGATSITVDVPAATPTGAPAVAANKAATEGPLAVVAAVSKKGDVYTVDITLFNRLYLSNDQANGTIGGVEISSMLPEGAKFLSATPTPSFDWRGIVWQKGLFPAIPNPYARGYQYKFTGGTGSVQVDAHYFGVGPTGASGVVSTGPIPLP